MPPPAEEVRHRQRRLATGTPMSPGAPKLDIRFSSRLTAVSAGSARRARRPYPAHFLESGLLGSAFDSLDQALRQLATAATSTPRRSTPGPASTR
jgi:hypothetical protein